MKEKILELTEELRDNIVLTVQELIKIPSVKGKAEENYPYGKDVLLALEKALEISEKMGLKHKNIDNYAGHIEIGEGEEVLALLCHVDVVPEGKDWTYPPYAAEIHDGKIYGRGTSDDKGPAAAALYALKIVNDMDIKLNKRVRLILGTNEESGMSSLDYYFEKEKMPELAFTPDAAFPAIHAEKGILNLKFSREFSPQPEKGIKLISLKGGNASNMVPDYAEAEIEGIEIEELKSLLEAVEYKNEALEIKESNKTVVLAYHGISAHGSTPKKGENAVSHLINILSEIAFASEEISDFLNFYSSKIGLEYYGESIGCADEDEIPTKLTFNTGIFNLSNDKVEFVVNIRYPVMSSSQKVVSDIEDAIKTDKIDLSVMSNIDPLYVPKDDPFIEKLMNAYQEFTGDDSQALAIGGGTYARKVKKGVAFGPLFPGRPELAHQKDENIIIDDLILSTAIYTKAIIDIAGEA